MRLAQLRSDSFRPSRIKAWSTSNLYSATWVAGGTAPNSRVLSDILIYQYKSTQFVLIYRYTYSLHSLAQRCNEALGLAGNHHEETGGPALPWRTIGV